MAIYVTGDVHGRAEHGSSRFAFKNWPLGRTLTRDDVVIVAGDDLIGGHHMLKFLNALAALATVGTFIIAFLNSYEVRIKVRRRTRGADSGRHLRHKRK